MNTLNKILKENASTYEEALQLFDELETVTVDFMIGKWKGEEIFTGHPMDGLLASTGWYGKIFESAEKVHPLVFYTDKTKSDLFAVNPTAVFKLQNTATDQNLFMADHRKDVETHEFKARLRNTEFRNSISATMIYDELPINDIFKKIDENTVFGAMDLKSQPRNYFFLLRRDLNK